MLQPHFLDRRQVIFTRGEDDMGAEAVHQPVQAELKEPADGQFKKGGLQVFDIFQCLFHLAAIVDTDDPRAGVRLQRTGQVGRNQQIPLQNKVDGRQTIVAPAGS